MLNTKTTPSSRPEMNEPRSGSLIAAERPCVSLKLWSSSREALVDTQHLQQGSSDLDSVTISPMLVRTVAEASECLSSVLAFAAIGFVCGIAGRMGFYGRRGSINAVLEARYYGSRPERVQSTSAMLRGVFLACLFSWVPFVGGWCPGFLENHPLLIVGLFCCCMSTGMWLLVRGAFQRRVESERTARIEQFVSDPAAPVPAAVSDAGPQWLRIWRWANVLLFGVLMIEPVLSVLALLRN
jgi:hypothetical protein